MTIRKWTGSKQVSHGMTRLRMALAIASLLALTVSAFSPALAGAAPQLGPANSSTKCSAQELFQRLKAAPTIANTPDATATPCADATAASNSGKLGKVGASAIAPIDLAAAVPMPEQLGDGFVNGGAQFADAAYFAAQDPDVTIDDLTGIGFMGTYDAALSLADPADPLTELQNVRVVLTQLGQDEGASGYLAGLPIDKGWAKLDGTIPVGDDVTLLEGSGTSGGRDFDAVGVRYRVGAVAVTLTISDWGRHPANGLERSADGITQLAGIVNDRLAAVQAGQFGGLEPMVLRLGEETHVYPVYYEAYLALDGQYVRRYGVSDDDAAAMQDRTAGLVDGYQEQQQLGTDEQDGVFNVRLLRFEDEASASTYMDRMRTEIVKEPTYASIDELPGDQTYGDDSVAYGYEIDNAQKVAKDGVRITARAGAMVVTISIETTTPPDKSVVEQLMTAELGCVSAGSCIQAIPLPTA